MNDEYLWDRSGAPDPEVQRLENLLGRLRHDRPAPEFAMPARAPRRLFWRVWIPAFAAAAALLLALGVWRFLRPAGPVSGWEVASLEGAPRADNRPLRKNSHLRPGQWLETDSVSRVSLAVDGLGRVDVEPNTRLRLLKASETEQHMLLDRGTIHADVTAPPYVFLTRTPSAYALDMGCSYTIHVDDDGAGILRVTLGWVEFQHGYLQSLVPAGAASETQPGIGPGAPYFEDSSEAFRSALHIVNFSLSDPQARSVALGTVLSEARPRDAFTLLNLFRRVEPADRGRLYDRLAALLPPPPGVTRESAVEGNWSRLDPWWPKLGLGSAKKGMKGPPRVEE
ncbi:MAG TPA: hypothetical protein VG033_08980 [Candidatus Acidoferrales bacterium]|jgi:ferric-dicitrate binding protein FerR (iron transport regulator)|nr:hypothetical protein [Candidatus Acidoferrales bacterium]